MTIRAQIEGGTTLEFPDGTDPAVVQRTVKQHLGKISGAGGGKEDVLTAPTGPDLPNPNATLETAPMATLNRVTNKAAQGATFGLIDPAAAALDATIDRATGKSDDWRKSYRVYRKTQEEADKGFSEKNPALATAAEVGGGIVGTGPVGKVAGAGSKVAGKVATDVIGGLGTHTGGESIRQAVMAGYEGGQRAEAFLNAMRGNAPMAKVVEDAKAAVAAMRNARNAAYKTGMGAIKSDAQILDFAGIDKAVTDASEIGAYKGKAISEDAAAAMDKVRQSVAEWKASPSYADFRTAEGFDALKQRIGAIRESTLPNTQARVAVDRVYNAVKNEIVRQAPAYGKVMKDYEEASDTVRELEQALSLGNRASADTALRKLQSVMRNNVNANYGNRLSMVEDLDKGGKIMPQLAGHALNSVTPRGLGSYEAAATVLGGAYDPRLLAALPFQSPRVVGEGAYYTGKLAGIPKNFADWVGDKGGNWIASIYNALGGK